MSLRDRCKEMLGRMQRDAMLRQGSPVDDLLAFVLSEKGRAADERLEDTMPLVLYFADEQGRDDMIALIREMHPGMMTKAMP